MGNKYFSSDQFQNTIAFAFKPQHMGQIVTIIDNNQEQFFSYYDLSDVKGSLNAQIIELYSFSIIEVSIPEATPPILDKADGDYVNVQKTNDWLWKTSRLELELYSKSVFGSWVLFGVVPIKHNAGFRYRRNRLLDMITDSVQGILGRGGSLGMKLVNVGFGNLNLPDQVNITGGWIQEPIIVQEHLPTVNNTANYYGSSASPSPSPSPTPTTNETINEFEIVVANSTVLVQPRATRTGLTITVIDAGAWGGAVGAWENNTWVGSTVDFAANAEGLVISQFNTWKGEMRANHSGFGDPGDEITLRIKETYTI